MDKNIKNAAIYLAVKSEKEDNYFISQKIEKMKQCCRRKDIEVNHIFVNYENGQDDFLKTYLKHLEEQIKTENIEVLITEDTENSFIIDNLEIEKVKL